VTMSNNTKIPPYLMFFEQMGEIGILLARTIKKGKFFSSNWKR
jgi:hypothetical protein